MSLTATSDRKGMEALLAFWVEAGVETAFEDAPVDRLAAPPARQPRQANASPRPAAPQAAATAPAAYAMSPAQPDGPSPDVAAALQVARDAAAATADLPALAAAIAAFDGCPLKFEGARQSVFSRGALDAPVMIIGEGPGGDEDRQGEPFVGRAGQLLDKMLAAAGLEGRVFITNTVFWRPPGNRTPTPSEQLVCTPFVERAIALVAPKVLLLVGGASAKSVLQKSEGILSLRGRWFDWRSSDGALELPAMPTLHPAFLLRQPMAKKKAWQDLMTLTERLDRPERPA